MRKEYITFLPVCSVRTADMLKTEAIWEVYQSIRQGGFRGKTAAQVCEDTHEPRSTVYLAIKQLEREGYIQGMKPEKIKKLGRPSRESERKRAGKTPKIYFEACELRAGITHRHEGEHENPWGDIIFSEDFFNEIGKILKNQAEVKEINRKIISFLRKFYKEKILASNNTEIKKLIPGDGICPNPECGKSHEGYELTKAMVLSIATHLLESEEFKELLKDLKFAH